MILHLYLIVVAYAMNIHQYFTAALFNLSIMVDI